MKKYVLLLYLLLQADSIFSQQRIEVVKKSGYLHNYVVKNFYYLEDFKDTSKVHYIATIKIEGKTNHDTYVAVKWLANMQTSMKRWGADVFKLRQYEEQDTTAFLVLDIYFGGENFIKNNKEKMCRNRIYLFGAKTNKDTSEFFLNDTMKCFYPKKMFEIKAEVNKNYNIAVNKNKITNTTVVLNSKKSVTYFIIPESNSDKTNSKISGNPANKGSSGIREAAMFGGLIGIGAYALLNTGRSNTVIEIPYQFGRLMQEIWK